MELREVNEMFDGVEETTELLSPSHRDNVEIESYFIQYAIQKEMINRNRCTASRRLLSQTAHLADFNLANGNHQKDTPSCVGISMIHTSNANWPPSRKREEAKALENLRKRVEQSKLYKANRITDTCESTSASLTSNDHVRQLDNRPKLLKKLCEYAQTWANHLAHTNTFYYRNDREVGQNLYCRPGGAVPTDVTGQDVASYWYSAVKQYDFLKEPDVLHANVNAGHFTQLIWASSRYFGVGKARSRSGKVIVVANYQPVGNISGQFQNNVLPPLPDNVNVALSSLPPQPSAKIFREDYVTSDSPPPVSSSVPFSDTASTDSDRSSVSSTQ
ncbi:uncharacterized protein LOC114877562 isoform X3 [Osmia bicornis bicornis]|uniref:uncharacterized protein LOC114877562 isoform X3 n=1 Tax=Osmia bicornis bicornis TaxID=1437191 RepID=UPI0010F547F9|nr:uncharacterized protein LOC114877562 isoform X3 [Osmia bicornis bicornis]